MWELRLRGEGVCEFGDSSKVVIMKDTDANADGGEGGGATSDQLQLRLGGRGYCLDRQVSGEVGADIWASAIAMAEYLEQSYGVRGGGGGGGGGASSGADGGNGPVSTALDGLRVLELGAGIGFVAQVLWDLGADVVATDKANMLPLLQANLQLHRDSADAVGSASAGGDGGGGCGGGGDGGGRGLVAVEFDWSNKPSSDLLDRGPYDMVRMATCSR